MSLELPSALSPYTDGDNHTSGAYALRLGRPLDLADAWERHYDERPPYWDQLMTADSVYYVGGASDLLSRLEDHRNGEVRQTVLTRVCDVTALQTAWPADNATEAFEIVEPRLARWLQNVQPASYVHTR
jgi:predicted GIY-YIG superfamily endonuclease